MLRAKKRTKSPYPIAFSPSFNVSTNFQMSPPLNSSGVVLTSCHISVCLLFQNSNVHFRLSISSCHSITPPRVHSYTDFLLPNWFLNIILNISFRYFECDKLEFLFLCLYTSGFLTKYQHAVKSTSWFKPWFFNFDDFNLSKENLVLKVFSHQLDNLG